MIHEKATLSGFLIILIFVLWQIKMYKHFKFLKKVYLIEGKNYLMFMMNPFNSGYYYMLILFPLVFSKAKNKNILIAKICSFLIWITFILIVSLDAD